jgi:hypothetical protein
MIPPVATAIVRKYTPEGFVIAADSRVSNYSTRKPIRDDQQKIFEIGQSLCFCICGYTLFRSDEGEAGDPSFDLNRVVNEVVGGIHSESFRDIREYAELLSRQIWIRLGSACSSGDVELPLKGVASGAIHPWLTSIYIDGYLNSVPQSAEIRLRRSEDGLDIPEVHSGIRQVMAATGSQRIYELLFTDQGRGINTLIEAIAAARHYIETCKVRGEELDPNGQCWGIGGKAQIATITAKDGFSWIERPE